MPTQTSTILIVEDSPEDYEAIRRGFRAAALPHALKHFEDGESVIQYLTDDTLEDYPVMIFLDLQMPGFSGVDVLKKLRESKNIGYIPVIMISSTFSEDELKQCYAAGANSFIQKPVSQPLFVAALKRIAAFWFDTVLLPSPKIST